MKIKIDNLLELPDWLIRAIIFGSYQNGKDGYVYVVNNKVIDEYKKYKGNT
jgi:hypothetical protein